MATGQFSVSARRPEDARPLKGKLRSPRSFVLPRTEAQIRFESEVQVGYSHWFNWLPRYAGGSVYGRSESGNGVYGATWILANLPVEGLPGYFEKNLPSLINAPRGMHPGLLSRPLKVPR